MNTFVEPSKPDGKNPARDPDFQLTLTRAMLETLELKRILYVILSGITAGDGLRFNRAFLFLVDEGRRFLEGRMAIGPGNSEEAHRIWEEMKEHPFDLKTLMQRYEIFSSDERASALSREINKLSFPLPPEQNEPPDSFILLLQTVFSERVPIIRNNLEIPIESTPIKLCNLLMAPLLISDKISGVLVCDNAYNRRPVTTEDVRDVLSLANLAAIAVERARLHERIRRMAEQDGLTGLANRRFFDMVLERKFNEAGERSTPISILFIDLDDFKTINDTHGHLAGDDVLREIATIIKSRIRRGDIAARYGGDELAVLLPGATTDQAAQIAEHILTEVNSTRFGQNGFSTSVSIGVACRNGFHTQPEDLLASTDNAVYEAKKTGKNRVVTATG